MEAVPTPGAGKLDNEGERIKTAGGKKKIVGVWKENPSPGSRDRRKYKYSHSRSTSTVLVDERTERSAAVPLVLYSILTRLHTTVLPFAAAMERTAFGNLTNEEVRRKE